MSDYLISCFDLLFNLIKNVDNILITLPFFSILISVLFGCVFNLIRGKYY